MHRLWRFGPIIVLAIVSTFGGWGVAWLSGLSTAAHMAAVLSQAPSSHQDFKFSHVPYRVPMTAAFNNRVIGDANSKTISKVEERGNQVPYLGIMQGKVPKRTLKGCECWGVVDRIASSYDIYYRRYHCVCVSSHRNKMAIAPLQFEIPSVGVLRGNTHKLLVLNVIPISRHTEPFVIT